MRKISLTIGQAKDLSILPKLIAPKDWTASIADLKHFSKASDKIEDVLLDSEFNQNIEEGNKKFKEFAAPYQEEIDQLNLEINSKNAGDRSEEMKTDRLKEIENDINNNYGEDIKKIIEEINTLKKELIEVELSDEQY